MRLMEMGIKPTAKKINKVMESRFGVKIDYANLDFKRAYVLARGLTESLDQIKRSHGVHVAECCRSGSRQAGFCGRSGGKQAGQ